MWLLENFKLNYISKKKKNVLPVPKVTKKAEQLEFFLNLHVEELDILNIYESVINLKNQKISHRSSGFVACLERPTSYFETLG